MNPEESKTDWEAWEAEMEDVTPWGMMARIYGLGLYQPQTDDEWQDYFDGGDRW